MGRETNGRITNAILNEQLKQVILNQEHLNKVVQENLKLFQEHTKEDIAYQAKMTLILMGDPENKDREGIVPRIAIIEKDRANKRKHWWVFYTAMVAIVLTKLVDWIRMISLMSGNATPK